MAKRRTKKDKKKANYSYLISWSPASKNDRHEPGVKRQFKIGKSESKEESRTTKNAEGTVKESSLASLKKDIIKSLVFASFILGIELVIYLAWR